MTLGRAGAADRTATTSVAASAERVAARVGDQTGRRAGDWTGKRAGDRVGDQTKHWQTRDEMTAGTVRIIDMASTITDAFETVGLDPAAVDRIVALALEEDLGGPDGVDVTSVAIIPADQTDVADVLARADGVVAGLAVAAAVFVHMDPRTHVEILVGDGARVHSGDALMTVSGPTRSLLTAERTAINLLSRMSGVATHTRRWADALTGTGALVLDTRKTTPGLRILEKYAVRAGGGTNKRMGLYDVAMIKDNHKLAAGSIAEAYRRVRETFPDVTVQVEVETVDEALEAIEAGAEFLLLDNMSPDQLREVVTAVAGRAELEATGGLTLDRARAFGETGVNYVSVGGLTHSSPILDLAMDLHPRV